MNTIEMINEVLNSLVHLITQIQFAAIFKSWGPFIIFFIGYFLSWRKSQNDKRNDDKIYRNLYIEWIVLAKTRTSEQAKNCKDFAENLMSNEFIDTVVFKSAPLMYERLNNMTFDKSIRAFVFNSTGNEKTNLKSFNNMIANINYLTVIGSELKEKYEKSYKSMEEINTSYNETLLKIDVIFFQKVTEVGADNHHKDARFVKILNDYRTLWEKSIIDKIQGSSTKNTIDKLIKPSLEFVKLSFNQNKTNAFLFEMYDQLNNMILVNRKWEVYKTGTSEIFKNYGEQIESSYEDLEKSVQFFQTNTTLQPFWRIR